MIPVILKGETSKPITLALAEGYDYSGCALHVVFCGVRHTFVDIDAGGSVELRFSAEQTARFRLGTSKVVLSIENTRGEICFMPWAKIKVTDSPAEVHDAQITIDPATLNVSDATSKDSLGAVKSKLNAVLAFLRGLSSLAVLALPLYALSDVAPLYSAFEDIPGDEQVLTNVVPYVEAKVTAATNAIPRTVIPDYWPLYAVTNESGTAVSRQDFDGLNIDGIGATANDAWLMATDALGGLSGVAQSATNYTDAALVAFAETGSVARATTYGTPTRWTDATGCVWEVVTSFSPWTMTYHMGWDDDNISQWVGPYWWQEGGPDPEMHDGAGWYLEPNATPICLGRTETALVLEYGEADHIAQWECELVTATNLVGRVALTSDIPDVSGYATNAAIAVADAKISTNNAAFVSAVLAVPLTGADAGDLAEISEYGGYGTVGAALLALIAGLAALKRRVTSAETALAQKASLADLPYRLVEPGKWEFSGVPEGHTITEGPYFQDGDGWIIVLDDVTLYYSDEMSESAMSLTWHYDADGATITATRASLPGHLLDRAGNRVVVSGDTTLTLPAAVAGYLRDFLVRLEISGSTVPTITFAAPTGETITYETDGDEFPVPDEAGTWSYSFTENCMSHKFAVSLKKVNEVAAPQAQGGS